MSFFSLVKKYGFDSMLLWIFSMFLFFSCFFIKQYETNNHNNTTIHCYYQGKWSDKKIHMVKKSYDDVCRVMNDSLNENHNLDTIHAKYALLMDSENGRILYEKDGFTKVPMASTTKIMTLIVVLENGNLDDLVTVSTNAAAQPDVQLNIKAQEQYRLKDLLYSLMLESHNDVAVAIAEHVGGSVEGFASMMNQKAKEIGAYDTHFVTPNGLDADNHYTTAKDLALIAKYCIENKMFCEIIQKKTYSFHEQTTGRVFTVNNKNRFLDSYEGAFGIKTGFTGKAGYCFVGAAKRDNKSFISVVLASGWPPHKLYKWNDTIRLMDYGMCNFHKKVIVEKNVSFQKVKVDNGIQCSDVTPCTKESVSLLVNDSESITYDVCLPKRLEAPIKNNQKIGTLTIKINNEIYKIIPLYSDKACKKITYVFCLKYILFQYFCHGAKVDFLPF